MRGSDTPVPRVRWHPGRGRRWTPPGRAEALAFASRSFALSFAALTLAFVLNACLIFWGGWPGAWRLLAEWGLLPPAAGVGPLTGGELALAWVQFWSYLGPVLLVKTYVALTLRRPLRADARRLSALAAYVVRAAFWAVVVIGIADLLISFLRVEDFLAGIVGDELALDLGRSVYRGTRVHLPLLLLAFVIALWGSALTFVWLAFLVVLAEFQIVISRFVFSYEQAFMGDLVRFWYAALFLLGSACTLVGEGHVRVDVFYARFSRRAQAWSNLAGSAVLGLPLCWTILAAGLWARGSSIMSPLLAFEISQSGFGLYVKYLMAGLLVVFAVSMALQFMSSFLNSAAELRGEEEPAAAPPSTPGT